MSHSVPSSINDTQARADTGDEEADRILDRLMSADSDFDDCIAAATFIRRLVIENKGPDAHATWKDTAIAERVKGKHAHSAGRKAGLEEAQEACRQQEREFLSPEYATQQPLSSFNERFACRQCVEAIEKLIGKIGEKA